MTLDIVDLEMKKYLILILNTIPSRIGLNTPFNILQHLSILSESVEPGSYEPAPNKRATGTQKMDNTRASKVKIVPSVSQPA